ncbi:hypothetical protein SLA2020_265890 [Shorea laevis]
MLSQRNPATGPNPLEMGAAEDHVVHLETVDISVQGAVHPNSTQLLAAVTQLVITMTQEKEVRQSFDGQDCTFKNFCSHNFNSFDGIGDHISVENWLNDIEELLEATGCNAS